MDYQAVAEQAKSARAVIATASTQTKNSALLAIKEAMAASRLSILQANLKDLDAGRNQGLDAALLDRLELNDARIGGMIEGVEHIIALPDPVGEISRMARRPSGIGVGLMRPPLGVIGIIYESRPNVTIDADVLWLKSGNA
jgi:glutamate-5-semialdehyde dehydrogenase